MKITVVENITLKAGLNDKSFDAVLDTSSLNNFEHIKQIFGICNLFCILIHYYINTGR